MLNIHLTRVKEVAFEHLVRQGNLTAVKNQLKIILI